MLLGNADVWKLPQVREGSRRGARAVLAPAEAQCGLGRGARPGGDATDEPSRQKNCMQDRSNDTHQEWTCYGLEGASWGAPGLPRGDRRLGAPIEPGLDRCGAGNVASKLGSGSR